MGNVFVRSDGQRLRIGALVAAASHRLARVKEDARRVLHGYRALRLKWTLEDLGPVPMRRRLTGQPILCGDCGVSEMTRSHACAGCGGSGFVPVGPGQVIAFGWREPGMHSLHLEI